MFKESELLLAVLQDLADDGVAARGLHDGIMVAESNKEQAIDVMATRARELTGIAIPVEEKP
jgi:hypothetical protein